MICTPCAQAADAEAAENRSATGDENRPKGHSPKLCRDAAIQPSGCGCAHRPAGTATEKTDAR